MHSVSSRMEKCLHVKEYTLAIEGVLNKINSDTIVKALNSLNLDQNLVRFTEFLLKSRVITPTVGASQCQRIICRSTPQGAFLSPFFWNLTVSSLLRRLEETMVITPQPRVTLIPSIEIQFISIGHIRSRPSTSLE